MPSHVLLDQSQGHLAIYNLYEMHRIREIYSKCTCTVINVIMSPLKQTPLTLDLLAYVYSSILYTMCL